MANFAEFAKCTKKINRIAHREGRTRSLKISETRDCHCLKSLTLYPIELGGRVYFSMMRIHKCYGPNGEEA